MKPRLLLFSLVLAIAAFAAGLLVGRGSTQAVQLDLRHNPDGAGTPVATFAEDSISAEELAARFAEMTPVARARYQTLAQKREYLEGLARFELLAREARARGLSDAPEVRETVKKVLVQLLLKQELDDQARPPTDEELAAYYQRHLADYVRPEQLRLSHIFLAVPRTDAARAAQVRTQAEALLAEVTALPAMDFRSFGTLAVKHSQEKRTRSLEGDLRYLTQEELATRYGPEVAQAASTLTQPGQVAPLVQTDLGFHILKLRTREPPLNQSLEQVRPQLLSRIGYEKRTSDYEAFLQSLETKWALQVDAQRLAEVPVDPTAPAQPASGPPPGFIPAPAGATSPPSAPRVPARVVPPSPTSGRAAPIAP